MAMKSIEELELEGKRIFIRPDLNVPLDSTGIITDDTRIRASLQTIRYVIRKGGRAIVASHLGRPKGKHVESMSLMPVAKALSELLERDVIMAPDCIGDGVRVVANQLKESEVMLLENLRFHPGEEANDPEFSKKLAELADVYINDAFGCSHRAHASIVGVPTIIKEKAAGFLLRKEIRYFERALSDPDRPLIAVLGGAKVTDKIPVIQNLLTKVDALLIGGGMAYTFLAAQGIYVADSLVDKSKLLIAQEILLEAENKRVPIMLPVDHIVSSEAKEGSPKRIIRNDGFKSGDKGLDIGPETAKQFAEKIAKSKTIIANGPMGVFEIPEFSEGTFSVMRAIANSGALSIIGGGDSVAAAAAAGVTDKITHISTGGGASLEMLEGKEFPGIVSLQTD